MEQSFWEHLIKSWENTYFTKLAIEVCAVIAILFSVRYKEKDRLAFLFRLYCASAIWLFLSNTVLRHFEISKRERDNLLELFNLFFLAIELLLFSIFFRLLYNTNKIRKTINTFLVLISILLLYFILKFFDTSYTPKRLQTLSANITLIEIVFLSIFCFYYFFFLFKTYSVEKLADRPSFWIMSALLFYVLIAFIAILAENTLSIPRYINTSFFCVHYISLSILFLSFAKAFTCKKPLTI